MGVLAVGSVAFDSIKTPFGKQEEILGGSASYFSLAASYFTEVSIVAIVGEDFTDKHLEVFSSKGIDLRGLERMPGKTFRWAGEYDYDLNSRRTLYTHLNVFADFKPEIIPEHRKLEYVFLGNIDPELQSLVLTQMKRPKLIACDTMNYWIERKYAELVKLLGRVDVLIINDSETRQLASEPNLLKAAKRVTTLMSRGDRERQPTIVIKRGEYGALMFNSRGWFSVPAFPIEDVLDPTGAGDAFAGGFVGYLAATEDLSSDNLKRAAVFGSVMASFGVEEFGLKRLQNLTYPEIIDRYREFRSMTHFEDIEIK